MKSINYSDLLSLLIPELIVVLTAFISLLVDLSAARRKPLELRMCLGGFITIIGSAAAIAWLALSWPGKQEFGDGMLLRGALTALVEKLVLVLTIFTAFISMSSKFTEHVGEYFALLLLATAGMMFLVSSQNLLVIFIALELLSVCLYVLTAFNKRNVKSAEASLKYFLFGSMSAAFLLFGLSLLYGLSGEINLGKMAVALNHGLTRDPLLFLGLIMVIVGFGFKVAAAPFHLWAPDAYEGAPAPAATFIASGSKVASFYILAQVLVLGFTGAEGSSAWAKFSPGWMPILAVVASVSMLWGNLAAIAQSSVRRLLAYSAVAQGGYILLGILAEGARTPGGNGLAALVYYVGTYALTIIGAFGVVEFVQSSSGDDRLSAFAGFSRRSPLLSLCMLVFMLSLAGIPPLAGFFGKFYLFTSALSVPNEPGLLWLVILAIATSAVSLYYYLQVLKQIFVAPGGLDASPSDRVRDGVSGSTRVTQAAIALLAVGVVVLGCAPNLVLEKILTLVRATRLL